MGCKDTRVRLYLKTRVGESSWQVVSSAFNVELMIRRKIYLTLIMMSLCISGFAQNMDIDLLRDINLQRNKNWDGTMEFVSASEGYIGFAAPVTVVLVSAVQRDKKLFQKGINMSFALAASTVRTYVLKHAINRDRPIVTYPDIDAYESERHYSFPSGHTSNAFVTATSLSMNFRKWYVVIPSFAWAGAVGYSRMHLGVHYPSDVLGGAVVGIASGWLTYQANKAIKKYYVAKKFVGADF